MLGRELAVDDSLARKELRDSLSHSASSVAIGTRRMWKTPETGNQSNAAFRRDSPASP